MEKERYELHVYDDVWVDLFDNGKELRNIASVDDVQNLLNQQDKRIKELERIAENEALEHLKLLQYDIVIKNLKQENQQFKEENNFFEKRNEELTIDRRDFCLERNDLFEENQQLKQSQNDKAIEALKKIKTYFLGTEDWLVDSCAIEEFIINQIKELESENESKNL